jgi:hypothetical protein
MFSLGSDVLADALIPKSASDLKSNLDSGIIPPVTEVLMVGLGASGKRPLLLARTKDHELLAYEVFPFYHKDMTKDNLKMRFKKLKHGLILRERKGK